MGNANLLSKMTRPGITTVRKKDQNTTSLDANLVRVVKKVPEDMNTAYSLMQLIDKIVENNSELVCGVISDILDDYSKSHAIAVEKMLSGIGESGSALVVINNLREKLQGKISYLELNFITRILQDFYDTIIFIANGEKVKAVTS